MNHKLSAIFATSIIALTGCSGFNDNNDYHEVIESFSFEQNIESVALLSDNDVIVSPDVIMVPSTTTLNIYTEHIPIEEDEETELEETEYEPTEDEGIEEPETLEEEAEVIEQEANTDEVESVDDIEVDSDNGSNNESNDTGSENNINSGNNSSGSSSNLNDNSNSQDSYKTRARAAADAAGCSGVPLTWDDDRVKPAYGAYDSVPGGLILMNIDMAVSQPHRVEWVATHECMHHRQALIYGGWGNTKDALGGESKAERITDLMTITFGMNSSHAYYTADGSDKEWEIAQKLLNGEAH